MKFSHNCNQTSLLCFKSIGYEISAENELIKLSLEIPWDDLVEVIAAKYSSKKGRNSKSLRVMLGLEIVKRKYGYSDEQLVEKLKTDLAVMNFCGLDEVFSGNIAPSSMTKFRNRLDEKTLALLEEASIRKFIRRAPRRRIHQVIVDSTCLEANITYPTDTKLLTKVYQKLIKVIEKGREMGMKIVIRGRRKVKKLVRVFNLKRMKSKKQIIKMRNFLIRQNQKILKKAQEVFDKLKLKGEEFQGKSELIIDTAKKIIEQQRAMAKEKAVRINDRIVSFHASKIRPIFRGKEQKKTEFGQKLGLSIIGGGLAVSTKLEHANFSDTTLPESAIAKHEKIFKRKPSELVGDRGLHSPKNHETLEKNNIRDGIQWRGKIPKKAIIPKPSENRRMYRQRSTVEGKLGTVKSFYGCDKNRYKDENCKVLVAFGLLAMNATWAAKRA